jgi:hypothetical protein
MCLRRLGLIVWANNIISCHAIWDTALSLQQQNKQVYACWNIRSDLGLLEDIRSSMTPVLKSTSWRAIYTYKHFPRIRLFGEIAIHMQRQKARTWRDPYSPNVNDNIYVFKTSVALSVNSVQLNRYVETDSYLSYSRNSPSFMGAKVHYCVYRGDPVLSQNIPLHVFVPYVPQISFNIILSSAPRFRRWSQLFRFPYWYFMCIISLLPRWAIWNVLADSAVSKVPLRAQGSS